MTSKAKGFRFSLIELLLVVCIGAAIVLAAVRYFGITGNNIDTTHAIQQIQILTKASYDWIQTQQQDDFSSANGGMAISMQRLIDANLIKNKPTYTKDPWTGHIAIQPGSDPTHIRITMTNVPKKACKNLARRLDVISQITMPSCNNTVNDYTGEF